jgi:DNA-binding MurR/RpiR family transcriptional regulator
MEKIFSTNPEGLGDTLNKIDMTVFDQAENILDKASRIEF